jgi:hypothetical protein
MIEKNVKKKIFILLKKKEQRFKIDHKTRKKIKFFKFFFFERKSDHDLKALIFIFILINYASNFLLLLKILLIS